MFEAIQPAPRDAILGISEAFKADPNPRKINLGVGVYQDDQGRTPILQAVKAAESRLLESERSKAYLPIGGDPEYGRLVQGLIFGDGCLATLGGRAQTAHTPGGTGALRVGAELLAKFSTRRRAWLSRPTWPNHAGIFKAAGYEVREYPYFDAAAMAVDFDGLRRALESVEEGDTVVLQVCCHNPTGFDLSPVQWEEVAAIAGRRRWIPFLDFAYQGLGDGLAEDRRGVRAVLEQADELLVASSFSKNFGLYNERTGALTIVAKDARAAGAAFSHAKAVIRVLYSNPPAHGGHIVATVLGDPALRQLWLGELEGMRLRIAEMRSALMRGLAARGVARDFSFMARQRGMFCFTGLTEEQVERLRQKSIYVVQGGRINVAGITSSNVEYLCDVVAEVLRAQGLQDAQVL